MVPQRASRSLALLMAAFVAAGIAGCLSADEPNAEFVATTPEGGWYFSDWDHGATNRTSMNATAAIDVNEVENTGRVTVRGEMGGRNFTVSIESFEHDPDDFHSGGVAANFDEHGDSGVGNTLLPKMHLLLATWGPGVLAFDGNETTDPFTGETTWDAHLMVTSTGVRDDATGKVTKADGSTPYDPAAPGDATIGGDDEVHLVLTSTYPNATVDPVNLTKEASIANPAGTVAVPFDVPVGAGQATVRIDMGDDAQELGSYSFELRDPNGTVAQGSILTVNPATPRTVTLTAAVDTAGIWSIVARSNAAPAGFTADISVTFPPRPMHYFFWEDVTIEERVVS